VELNQLSLQLLDLDNLLLRRLVPVGSASLLELVLDLLQDLEHSVEEGQDLEQVNLQREVPSRVVLPSVVLPHPKPLQ